MLLVGLSKNRLPAGGGKYQRRNTIWINKIELGWRCRATCTQIRGGSKMEIVPAAGLSLAAPRPATCVLLLSSTAGIEPVRVIRHQVTRQPRLTA
jgi:hypothetical protein